MKPREEMRTCRVCGQAFPICEFPRYRKRTGASVTIYVRYLCVACDRARNAAHHRAAYARDPQRIHAQKQRYESAHPERVAARHRRYRQENREQVAACVRECRARRAARLEQQRAHKLARLAAEERHRRQQAAALTAAREEFWRAAATRVLAVVLDLFGISHAALLGTAKDAYLVEARRIAAYILQVDVGLGPTEAGKLLNRDHSTCLHHRAVLEKRIAAGTLSMEDRWGIEEVRRVVAEGARRQRAG